MGIQAAGMCSLSWFRDRQGTENSRRELWITNVIQKSKQHTHCVKALNKWKRDLSRREVLILVYDEKGSMEDL